MAVLGDGTYELVFGDDGLEIPAEGGEHGVPDACAEGCEGDELGEPHLGQSCGYGDELAHCGDEPSGEGSYGSVLAEEFLGSLYLALVE